MTGARAWWFRARGSSSVRDGDAVGGDHVEIPITARTPDGEIVTTEAFASLVG